mmetsp:Transcript_12475/g.29894  ORF Transcript_12475/g.29894 Transcript_12475/m.29894 type:complete len:245 (+) Transcript_12475:13-747(+)
MAGGYGAIEGSAPQESRSRVPKALIGGALAVVAVVAVVLGYASSSAHVSLPAERLQMVELPGPRSAVMLNSINSRGFMSLEQALDRVVEPARTFQHVDHEQLAQLLKDHLLVRQQQLKGGSYPFGYPRSGGWHQEIVNYDPKDDGCDCAIDEGKDQLSCSCGSVWGAITLMDEGCYGCCASGCCNQCTCSYSNSDVGPTACTCPLANKWNYRSTCSWWEDNAGPLDPGGTGGIPEVEDEMGLLQ